MIQLLSLQDAAARLSVSTHSLRRAADKHGMLIRIGGRLRIEAERIPDLIERCREPVGQG